MKLIYDKNDVKQFNETKKISFYFGNEMYDETGVLTEAHGSKYMRIKKRVIDDLLDNPKEEREYFIELEVLE